MNIEIKFNPKKTSLGINDYVNIISKVISNTNFTKKIVWFPCNLGFTTKKYILTVHDLIGLSRNYKEIRLKKIIRFFYLYISLMFAEKVITVTESVKFEIEEKFRLINKSKIIVIKSGFNFPDLINYECNRIINNDYLLAVSNSLQHKNLQLLIETFDHKKHVNLIIIGKLSNHHINLCKNKKIHIVEYLLNEELNSYIKYCTAFISTSLIEGFGMPAAIARYYRRPLILYDNKVYRELHENYAKFFNNSQQLYKLMKKENIDNRLNFDEILPSWEDAGKQYADLIRNL